MSGGRFHAGKIVARRLASPTVAVLDLHVPESSSSSFTFEAGQWIDLTAPLQSWVGGFSPASLPRELPRLTVAVKKKKKNRSSEQHHEDDDDAPAVRWVHDVREDRTGAVVRVRAGGNTVLDTRDRYRPVVFCAGGIGVSPLLSMYRQWTEWQNTLHSETSHDGGNVTTTTPTASFLYSVSDEEELVFVDQLVRQAALGEGVTKHDVTLTLTRRTTWNERRRDDLRCAHHHVTCRTGRRVREFLHTADRASSFYICGPPAMLDHGVAVLQERGIEDEHIHFERWW